MAFLRVIFIKKYCTVVRCNFHYSLHMDSVCFGREFDFLERFCCVHQSNGKNVLYSNFNEWIQFVALGVVNTLRITFPCSVMDL